MANVLVIDFIVDILKNVLTNRDEDKDFGDNGKCVSDCHYCGYKIKRTYQQDKHVQ